MKKSEILNVLKEIIDPEIGFSIVDLGFVTDVKIENKKITVKLVLTSPLCPLASIIFSEVENKLKEKFKDFEISVEYDFETVWTPDRIKPEIREKLGI